MFYTCTYPTRKKLQEGVVVVCKLVVVVGDKLSLLAWVGIEVGLVLSKPLLGVVGVVEVLS